MAESCFCGSGKTFGRCCGPIVEGKKPARTPEELMRARYSAHCLRKYEFLVTSTHPDRREGVSEKEVAEWAQHVEWTGLEVHSAVPGPDDTTGQVSFTAHYTIQDTAQELREDAEFQKEDDTWYYVDAKFTAPSSSGAKPPRWGATIPVPAEAARNSRNAAARELMVERPPASLDSGRAVREPVEGAGGRPLC